MRPVPVMRPVMPPVASVVPRLDAIQRSGTFSNFGPQVIELEERLATHVGCGREKVVACSSATVGLMGAVMSTDVRHWAVPSFTFTATPAAVLGAGATLSWWDVNRESWWASPTAQPPDPDVGLLPVAPFGAAVDLDRFSSISEVVVDAAASMGARNPLLTALPATWSVVFSLHATKVLPAGEGGFVVFGDAERARRFRSWTNFGLSGTRESTLQGTNAKMSEHTAAWAHASLDRWPQEQEEWAAAREVADGIADKIGLESFNPPGALTNPYWVVRFEDTHVCDRVERVLNDAGIGNRRWWAQGCHRMPAYTGVSDRPVPITEDIAPRYLGLPFFRGMTAEDGEAVLATLSRALRISAT